MMQCLWMVNIEDKKPNPHNGHWGKCCKYIMETMPMKIILKIMNMLDGYDYLTFGTDVQFA